MRRDKEEEKRLLEERVMIAQFMGWKLKRFFFSKSNEEYEKSVEYFAGCPEWLEDKKVAVLDFDQDWEKFMTVYSKIVKAFKKGEYDRMDKALLIFDELMTSVTECDRERAYKCLVSFINHLNIHNTPANNTKRRKR